MQLINRFVATSQSSFDLLNFIGIAITVISSIYIFKAGNSISFSKERHDKLIFPLFNALEPVLYSELDMDVLRQALEIIEANKNLADGKLLNIYYCCSENPTQYNFKSLCAYADSAYDKSCRRLGLGTRSLMYRYFRHQFRNKLQVFLFFLVYLFGRLVLMVLCLLVLLLISCAFFIFFDASGQTDQIVLLLVFSGFLAAITWYMNNHY